MEEMQKDLTRFFHNRTHFFDFLVHFKVFFTFFFKNESDYKKIVLLAEHNAIMMVLQEYLDQQAKIQKKKFSQIDEE